MFIMMFRGELYSNCRKSTRLFSDLKVCWLFCKIVTWVLCSISRCVAVNKSVYFQMLPTLNHKHLFISSIWVIVILIFLHNFVGTLLFVTHTFHLLLGECSKLWNVSTLCCIKYFLDIIYLTLIALFAFSLCESHFIYAVFYTLM